jgi:hypothetical protein
MKDIEHIIYLVRERFNDWVLGHIQTQVIKFAFPAAWGFQIANWAHAPYIFPINSVASDIMYWAWLGDLIATGVFLLIYLFCKPQEFIQKFGEVLQRFLPH